METPTSPIFQTTQPLQAEGQGYSLTGLAQAFVKTHSYLVENSRVPLRRALMDKVDWRQRLIAIKGSRGVGKTTFLLEYAKERFGANDPRCLYVNLNNFYFQAYSLYAFASEFYRRGGRTLLLDQVYKVPDWSAQLRLCYDTLPGLHIVFAGSSVINLNEETPELEGIVSEYSLRGLSFREFINIKAGLSLRPVTLDEVLGNSAGVATEVARQCEVQALFGEYLRRGYYPYFLEKSRYSGYMLKLMNMMIEVDILMVKQIEMKYIGRIKRLLYLLAEAGDATPNISRLAQDIGTSRATVMNYIKYLSNARLITVQYKAGKSHAHKPLRITMHNPNLMFAILPNRVDRRELLECFLQSALRPVCDISVGDRTCDFIAADRHRLRIVEERPKRRSPSIHYLSNSPQALRNELLPLWVFGMLY